MGCVECRDREAEAEGPPPTLAESRGLCRAPQGAFWPWRTAWWGPCGPGEARTFPDDGRGEARERELQLGRLPFSGARTSP